VLLDLTEDQLFDVRGKSRVGLPVISVPVVITQLEEAEARASCSQSTLVVGWQHEAGAYRTVEELRGSQRNRRRVVAALREDAGRRKVAPPGLAAATP